MIKNTTRTVKAQAIPPRQIKPYERIRCVKQGNSIAEVISMEREAKPGALKLNKHEYMVISTGEVRTYQHNTTKQRGNLKKTFRELRYLIRTNFTEKAENQLFVTLTYAENMTDEKQLYLDFKDYMKRLKYRFKEHSFEYIVVIEPQERGAWHAHLMLKSDRDKLYIDHSVMSQIWGDENILRQAYIDAGNSAKEGKTLEFEKLAEWAKKNKDKLPSGYRPIKGHGWTTTERLKSDDVGAYYVAYFTDLIDESGEADLTSKSKARKKGARLDYYPMGFRFYRCSRGIKRPEIRQDEYGQIVEQYGQPVQKLAYQVEEIEGEVVEIEDARRRILNRVQREEFNKNRDGND